MYTAFRYDMALVRWSDLRFESGGSTENYMLFSGSAKLTRAGHGNLRLSLKLLPYSIR